MPRCSDCGFLYDVKRGPCPECGWGRTLPATEEDESQQRKVEAERAEWGRQQPPTRHGCLGSLIAMVVVVAGIVLLVPAAWLTLVGLSSWMGGPEPIEEARWLKGLALALSEVGLAGVALAVGLIAIGVLVWRRYE